MGVPTIRFDKMGIIEFMVIWLKLLELLNGVVFVDVVECNYKAKIKLTW